MSYSVGDRIRYTYWVDPRGHEWHYATVTEILEPGVYSLDHEGDFQTAVNLNAVAHHELVSCDSVERAAAKCEQELKSLERLFQRECKLTLLIRAPFEHDGDILLTKDDLSLVQKAIQRLQEREQK